MTKCSKTKCSKQSKQSKQKGGGMHDVFCPLCNLPFYSPFDEHNKPPKDDEEDEELYALRNTDLNWLSDVLGFDEKTHTVMELESDDHYGRFPIKNGKGNKEFALKTDAQVNVGRKKREDFEGFGIAFHKDCTTYISRKSGKPLNYQLGVDIENKIEHYFEANPKMRRDDDYQQQNYNFEKALEDNGPEMFVSPLDKGGKKIQHLLDDFLPAKKTATPPPPTRDIFGYDGYLPDSPWKPSAASPKKKAASPLKEAVTPPPPTRDIFGNDYDYSPQKKAASPQKNISPGAVSSCSSQKDKAICIKKKCVWGKTNRCSKKRSTRKNKSSSPKSSSSSSSCPSHKNKEECVKNKCNWGKTNRCSKKRVSKK